jgi:hypothetical protein
MKALDLGRTLKLRRGNPILQVLEDRGDGRAGELEDRSPLGKVSRSSFFPGAKPRPAREVEYTWAAEGIDMDATGIFLASLVLLTTILGIGALIGLLLSTWYILVPIALLATVLILVNSGFLIYAFSAAALLALVLWREYRVLRG